MAVTSAALVGISLWFTQPILSAEKHGKPIQTALGLITSWSGSVIAPEIRRYSAEQPFLHRIHQGLACASHSHSVFGRVIARRK